MNRIRQFFIIPLCPMVNALSYLAILGTLAAFVSFLPWPIELFSHFRWQYFLGLCAATLWMLLAKRRRWAIAVAVGALLNVPGLLSYLPTNSIPTVLNSSQIRLVHANILLHPRAPDAIIALAEDTRPDILILFETNEYWFEALTPIETTLPFTHHQEGPGGFGLSVYSRLPFDASDAIFFSELPVPSLELSLAIDRRPLTIIATHPPAPYKNLLREQRDQQLLAIAERSNEISHPLLVVGDFNITPWSHAFGQMLKQSNLVNAAVGRGLQPSWPSKLGWFGIPIDHSLHNTEIQVVSRTIGADVGSDHRPVILDFVVAEQTPTPEPRPDK